jgi:hypothetical protein
MEAPTRTGTPTHTYHTSSEGEMHWGAVKQVHQHWDSCAGAGHQHSVWPRALVKYTAEHYWDGGGSAD